MRTTEARNVLKVEPGASQDEIRRAYRREALRWHPDKNMGNTEAAARSFQHVQEAVLALRENDGESCKENLRSRLQENLRSRLRNVDWTKFHEEGKERRMEAVHAQEQERMQAACQRVRDGVHTPLRMLSTWQRVPSISRPGKISYQHIRTGVKQSNFPTRSEPTAEEIAEHLARAAAASASGRPRAAARAAPASAEVASTASWPKWRWLGRR